MEKKKVLVAVSGGVDSAVALYLLKSAGYSVTAIMLRLFDKKDGFGNVITTEADSARDVCQKLGVELVVPDYRKEFEKDVIADFAESYIKGLTPNPCVQCNRTVKFRYTFDYADKNGFDFVATGHYATVSLNEATGVYELIKGADERKDQSYVLYSLTQKELSRLILPLGKYSKAEVRALAEQAGFSNANKADSQDICFITGDYYDFITSFTNRDFPQGDFVDKDGKVLGRHKGIICYTIGQRKGLGLSFDSPRYVISKSIENNTVTLGKEEELFSNLVYARNVNIISSEEITVPVPVTAMTRYNQKPQKALVYPADANGVIKVEFELPQRAPTPGQSLVMYKENVLFGGGIII